ncbi:MAG: hypothetical protein AB7N71_04705, partial [Phycisphaerae bacterium]
MIQRASECGLLKSEALVEERPPRTHIVGLTRPRWGDDLRAGFGKFFGDLLQGSKALVEVGFRVAGGDLAAESGFAARDDGETESADEDALIEERLLHFDRGCGFADDDRHD